MKTQTILLVASLVMMGSIAKAQSAPSINIGCFQYGPNPGCDLSQNPPSINTGGFHYGPQTPQPAPQTTRRPRAK